jgi:hypothetical protein
VLVVSVDLDFVFLGLFLDLTDVVLIALLDVGDLLLKRLVTLLLAHLLRAVLSLQCVQIRLLLLLRQLVLQTRVIPLLGDLRSQLVDLLVQLLNLRGFDNNLVAEG